MYEKMMKEHDEEFAKAPKCPYDPSESSICLSKHLKKEITPKQCTQCFVYSATSMIMQGRPAEAYRIIRNLTNFFIEQGLWKKNEEEQSS